MSAIMMIRHLLSNPTSKASSGKDVTDRQASRVEWIHAQKALMIRLDATACF